MHLLSNFYVTCLTYSVTEAVNGSDDALCGVCKFTQTDAQVLASDIVCRSCVLFELFKIGLHFLNYKSADSLIAIRTICTDLL